MLGKLLLDNQILQNPSLAPLAAGVLLASNLGTDVRTTPQEQSHVIQMPIPEENKEEDIQSGDEDESSSLLTPRNSGQEQVINQQNPQRGRSDGSLSQGTDIIPDITGIQLRSPFVDLYDGAQTPSIQQVDEVMAENIQQPPQELPQEEQKQYESWIRQQITKIYNSPHKNKAFQLAELAFNGYIWWVISSEKKMLGLDNSDTKQIIGYENLDQLEQKPIPSQCKRVIYFDPSVNRYKSRVICESFGSQSRSYNNV